MIKSAETKELLENQEYRLAADELLWKCGLHANLSGYKYMIDALILYSTQACSRICEIYDVIGEVYGRSQKAITRSINYSILKVENFSERLSEIVCKEVPQKFLHNGFVIAHLSHQMPCFRDNVFGAAKENKEQK